jgi:hypothetical protein
MMSHHKLYFCIVASTSVFFTSILGVLLLVAFPFWPRPVTKGMSIAATTTPFLNRPYYGDQTVLQRTISFFDHDDPWYFNDHRFVRFDGATWSNTSVGNCVAGTNCYDGHNGYDLNLRFEPVLSAAAGTVVRANWYNPLNHNDAFGLWVAIDHGNGYVTAYGHLSMITVAVGDRVGSQWQIGTSGTTGSSTGPHLHMSVYYLPNWQPTDPFGWTGRHADPNVVPDHYLWAAQSNAPSPVPDLAGSSAYAGAIVVDDSDQGWSATGSWTSSAASSDVKGNMHWTITTSGSSGATATWHPTLPADGYYEIGVYIDDNHAGSSWAPYTVYSADPIHNGVVLQHSVYVDQSHISLSQGEFGTVRNGPQWISLGTYYFRASMNGNESVVLHAATGVPSEQLGADGMEFVPLGNDLALSPSLDEQSVQIPSAVSEHASRSYYFAEGYTGAGTTEQLALTNLAASPATVSITYYYPNAAPQFCTYQIAADAHRNLNINREAGANQSVSMIVQGNQPFMAERTMYTQKNGFVAATHSQGATMPSRRWYFAEGNTTFGWNTLLAILNPGAQPTTLTMHFLLTPGSSPFSAHSANNAYTLPPQTRSTIVLNDVLPNRQFGLVLTAGSAVVVERAEYLVQSPWQGGSTVVGATAPQKTWYFATGNTTAGFTETLVLSNPTSLPVHAHIRYLLIDGQAGTQHVTLPPLSRIALPVNAVVEHAIHATVLTADGPLVAERQDFFATTQQSTMRGSSTVMGSSQAALLWYIPQMTATEGIQGTLTLTNPGATTVQAQIILYRAAGPPLVKSYALAAHQCLIIAQTSLLGTKQEAGLAVSASSPVVVEHNPFFARSQDLTI